MKKILVVVLMISFVFVVGNSVEANEVEKEVEMTGLELSVGAGFIAIPEQSGALIEGTFHLSPSFDIFVGVTPFNDGAIFKSVGADYKFDLADQPELKPGLGVIAVVGEGFSPTVSISIINEEPDGPKVTLTGRGGINVISASAGIRF